MDGLQSGEILDGTAAGVELDDDIGLAPALEPEKTVAPGLQQKLDDIQAETGKEAENKEVTEKLEELKQLTTDQETDTDLIKSLRASLRTKVGEFEPLAQFVQGQTQENNITEPTAPSERETRALDLYDSLFEFDPNEGKPVTEGFVKKIVDFGPALANQVGLDLAMQPINDPNLPIGWTPGHSFLVKIGLDPNKIEILREVSRDSSKADEYGVIEVPDYVLPEYAKAYKALPHILRVDVDSYLTATGRGAEERKLAGLQVLQDTNNRLLRDEIKERDSQQQQTNLEKDSQSDANILMVSTFTTILDSLKQNPAYTSINISADSLIDKTFKDSLISQINALGDDNSLLASRAALNLSEYGVKVEQIKVKELLGSIQNNAKIIAKAERLQKMNPNVDYKPQIEAAKDRLGTAALKATALGNKYFSDALEFLSNSGKLPAGKQPEGLPNLDRNSSGAINNNSDSNKILTPQDLEALVLNAAKNNAESSAHV